MDFSMLPMAQRCMDTLLACREDTIKFLREIRRLDINTHRKALQCDEKMKELDGTGKSFSKDGTNLFQKEIMSYFDDISKLADKKIKLSTHLYEVVDKYIRKLDDGWAKMQESRKRVSKSECAIVEDGKYGRRKRGPPVRKKVKSSEAYTASPLGVKQYLESGLVTEMPVDPNEPTYCICNQVSFGEMIMCDNKHCKTEWFHFQCVGIKESPKGKWYCKQCIEDRKKKPKRIFKH